MVMSAETFRVKPLVTITEDVKHDRVETIWPLIDPFVHGVHGDLACS